MSEAFHDIFLSYARKDSQRARLLRGYFRSHNLNSWIDFDHIKFTSPQKDEELDQTIKDKILSCRYFVVVVSVDSVKDSKWVKTETEFALQAYRDDKIEGVIGIQIDKYDNLEIPEWMEAINIKQVAERTLEDHDRLADLRDQIGEKNPTYINDVSPNFLKQIKLGVMSDHLKMCKGETFDMWFLNGGYSTDHYIEPALSAILRNEELLKARVLLLDTPELKGYPKKKSYDEKFEKKLQKRLEKSRFFKKNGKHFDFLKDTIVTFLEIEKVCKNFTVEFRVTKSIPAGRIILFGHNGFYSPFMSKPNADLPFFVFDQNSPFYNPVSDYFYKTYEDARIIDPSYLLPIEDEEDED